MIKLKYTLQEWLKVISVLKTLSEHDINTINRVKNFMMLYDDKDFNFVTSDVISYFSEIQARMINMFCIATIIKSEPNTNIEGKMIMRIKYGLGGDDAKDIVDNFAKLFIRDIKSKAWGDNGSYCFEIFSLNDFCRLFVVLFGKHKIVRLSPFTFKRQTSIITFDFVFDSAPDIKLNEKDLRIEVFRSSGKGGQHANKTESGVKITYMPLKISARIETTRSQIKNKEIAFAILAEKIREKQIDEFIEQQKQKKNKEHINFTHLWSFYPEKYIKCVNSGFKYFNFNNPYDLKVMEYINLNLKRRIFIDLL